MSQLAITLFGAFSVTLDGQPVPRFKMDKMCALLAYLAVAQGSAHRREKLAGLLWPDYPEGAARHNLSQTLLRLRKALREAEGTPLFLLATRQTLRLNPASNVIVDVALFEAGVAACAQVMPDQFTVKQAQDLAQAVAHYQGEFLATPLQINSQAYEEWLLFTRIHLHLMALDALDTLTQYHIYHHEFEQAATYARRQIELDPLHEAAQRQLMTALAQDGQRAEALAQYAACQALLATELGIAPDPETTALYERVRAMQHNTESQYPQRKAKLGTGPLFPPPPVFVGRDRELARLDAALRLTLAGQGQMLFITGEAGYGKSALLAAFARRAQAIQTPVRVLRGSGNAYTGQGDPYWPFIEMLRPVAAAQGLPVCGPALASLLTGETDLTFNATQSRIFAQITQALYALAARDPLILLLDDAQWTDTVSLNLLFHLGRQLDGQRLLIVVAMRPAVLNTMYTPSDVAATSPAAQQAHPLATLYSELQRYLGDIQLDLAQAEGRTFIDALLDSEPNHLDADFRETFYRHTGGHALFSTELWQGMQARGALVRDAQGYWVPGEDLAWHTLPARVEGVIATRIRQLLPDWQAILTVASVEGDEFTAQVVAQVLDLAVAEVRRRLSGALARQYHLVVPVNEQTLGPHSVSRYRFRHLLFQQYLYAQLDPVERGHLHLKVGRILETLYGTRASDISLSLARHFELGGVINKAVAYLILAGQRAAHLAATEEALQLLTHGLALLKHLEKSPARDQQEIDVQLALGAALLSQGWAGEERAQAVERAYALCQHTGDPSQVARSLVMLTYSKLARGQWEQAIVSGEHLFSLAESTQDTQTATLAHFVLGSVFYFKGDLLPARQHLEPAIALYDAEAHTAMTLTGADIGVSSRVWLGQVLWALGYADQALTCSQGAVTLAQALEHIPSLDLALSIGMLSVRQFRQEPQAMRSALQQRGQSLAASPSIFQFWSTLFRGWLAAVDAHDPGGLSQIQTAMRQWDATGTRVGRIQGAALLVEAYLALGQAAAARALSNQLLAQIATTGLHFFEAELHRLHGEALHALGHHQDAETCFQRAIAVAQAYSAKAWELRAAMSLCRLYRATGQAALLADARTQLAEVYAWFTEGLDTADLQEAATLLAEASIQ